MRRRSHISTPHRRLALLTAISFFWLSAFGPFFHTDCIGERPSKAAGYASVALGGASLQSGALAKVLRPADRCLACEWQANSVCVALSAFIVPHQDYGAVPAAQSQYAHLPTLSFETPSRAPPSA